MHVLNVLLNTATTVKERKMQSKKNLVVLIAVMLTLPLQVLAAEGWLKAVHAIDGRDLGANKKFKVDISVEGACALPNFAYGDITPYIPLPAGTYTVDISPADGACGNSAVLSAEVKIRSGRYTTAAAHLDADGGPTASIFNDDQSAARDRFGRLTVRHLAAAPTVDVTGSRSETKINNFVFSGLSNGEQGSITLRNKTFYAKIFPYLDSTLVAGPVEAPITAGANLVVYAAGSLANDTFTLLVDAEALEAN
jgi:hypothetical protein